MDDELSTLRNLEFRQSRIEALTLCWVSTGRDYTILCDDCHRLVASAPGS